MISLNWAGTAIEFVAKAQDRGISFAPVFHLNSNRPIYFDRFLETVRELGISMEVVDGDAFNRALRGTIRDRVTEYIFEAFQNDMDGMSRGGWCMTVISIYSRRLRLEQGSGLTGSLVCFLREHAQRMPSRKAKLFEPVHESIVR